jgi:hypothetical protein
LDEPRVTDAHGGVRTSGVLEPIAQQVVAQGHFQKVHQIRLDCDDDVLLLQVEQVGGMACHTGRHSCFFHELQSNDGAMGWVEVEPVLKNPDDIYKK